MRFEPLSAWDVAYSVNRAIPCLISYCIVTQALSGLVGGATDYLGGMWASVATLFVFRNTREGSMSAGAQRFMVTCVSFALCLLYLRIFPFEAVGVAAMLAISMLELASNAVDLPSDEEGCRYATAMLKTKRLITAPVQFRVNDATISQHYLAP
jgi:hypothetical protein